MSSFAPLGDSRIIDGRQRFRWATDDQTFLGRIDWMLVALTALCSAFGALMVFSATRFALARSELPETYFLQRQLIMLTLGVIGCVICTVIDYRRLLSLAPLLYVGTCIALLGVRFVGAATGGTTAWFQVGPIQFQPSEFAKVAFAICLASYVANQRGPFTARRLTSLLVLASLPILLVFLQGDLGTSLVFVAMLFAVILVSGAKARHIAAVFGGAAVIAVLAVSLGVLKDYQIARLTSFTQQTDKGIGDSQNLAADAYNLAQSKKAIGSGGILGKGLFEGPLTNLSYVPVQKSDFIFSAVGEQLGFVGSSGLIICLGAIMWRIWRMSLKARDHAGLLLCVAILAMILFQTFENIGMTIGIMPITGIPLPFISYGGTALVASWCAIGLVVNVGARRKI
jgi:rod shape determining protein RodA